MKPSTQSMILALVALLISAGIVASALARASSSLDEQRAAPSQAPAAAVAAVSDDNYCTPALKAIIRRVAGSCGLIPSGSGGRGCQPMEVRKVAALSDDDFNALFRPLEKRVHLIQFDADQAELDPQGKAEVEKAWADQRGASFFFVVARASADGGTAHNEALSQRRAEAVLGHLEATFDDPELKKEVGLLWLGDSFAQLGSEFCSWQRSRDAECDVKEINRSAFVAWIDCAI